MFDFPLICLAPTEYSDTKLTFSIKIISLRVHFESLWSGLFIAVLSIQKAKHIHYISANQSNTLVSSHTLKFIQLPSLPWNAFCNSWVWSWTIGPVHQWYSDIQVGCDFTCGYRFICKQITYSQMNRHASQGHCIINFFIDWLPNDLTQKKAIVTFCQDVTIT